MARRRIVLVPGAALTLTFLISALGASVAAGGGGCHAQLERDATETTVRMTRSCFDPMIARVPTGAIVRFVNADDDAHVVLGAAGTWGTFDHLGGGDSIAWRFTQPGVYPYACYLHPSMIGAIVVADGSPGGTGRSVQQVKAPLQAPTPVTAPSPTGAATAERTDEPTDEPTGSPATAAAPVTTAPPSDAAGPTGLLILGPLAVLLGAGAAYGLGMLPGMARLRTRSR